MAVLAPWPPGALTRTMLAPGRTPAGRESCGAAPAGLDILMIVGWGEAFTGDGKAGLATGTATEAGAAAWTTGA